MTLAAQVLIGLIRRLYADERLSYDEIANLADMVENDDGEERADLAFAIRMALIQHEADQMDQHPSA